MDHFFARIKTLRVESRGVKDERRPIAVAASGKIDEPVEARAAEAFRPRTVFCREALDSRRRGRAETETNFGIEKKSGPKFDPLFSR